MKKGGVMRRKKNRIYYPLQLHGLGVRVLDTYFHGKKKGDHA